VAATIDEDGRVTIVPAWPPTQARMHHMGNVYAPLGKMKRIFGAPDFGFVDGVDASTEGWQVRTPDGVAHVYRLPNGHAGDDPACIWRIDSLPQNRNNEAVAWIRNAVNPTKTTLSEVQEEG
jgi:hypothetical protein